MLVSTIIMIKFICTLSLPVLFFAWMAVQVQIKTAEKMASPFNRELPMNMTKATQSMMMVQVTSSQPSATPVFLRLMAVWRIKAEHNQPE